MRPTERNIIIKLLKDKSKERILKVPTKKNWSHTKNLNKIPADQQITHQNTWELESTGLVYSKY